jgi:hypothetical protein
VGRGNHNMMPPPVNQQVQGLSSPAAGFPDIFLGKATAEFENGVYDPFCQAEPEATNNGLGISPLYMHKPLYGTASYIQPSDTKKHRSTEEGGKASNMVLYELEDSDENDIFLS